MKKLKQHIWKIVLCLVVIGIALIILGISLGAKHGVYIDKTGIHMVDDYEYQETKFDLEAFSNVTLDMNNIDIEFIESDTYGLELCYYDTDYPINWHLENGDLKVESIEQSKIRFLNFDFSFFTTGFKKSSVKIYLPSGIELERVLIKSSSGDVSIEHMNAKSLNLTNSYGNLALNAITIPSININLISGNFIGKNILADELIISDDYGNLHFEEISSKYLNMTTKSGECFIRNSSTDDMHIKCNYGNITGNNLISNKLNIATDSGNIKLDGEFIQETILYSKYGNITLDTNRDKNFYSADFSTKYGKIVINNETLKDRLSYINDVGDTILNVTTDSGNIYMSFNKN